MATQQQAHDDLTRYCRAMADGNGHHTCVAIEQRYGLYGYPPQLVTVGLQAFAEGGELAMARALDKALGIGDDDPEPAA